MPVAAENPTPSLSLPVLCCVEDTFRVEGIYIYDGRVYRRREKK